MEKLFLIKYGEISLKGENQYHFINILKNNIKRRLKGVRTVMHHKPGRFYLQFEPADKAQIAGVLSTTFGIVGFTEALVVEKNLEAIDAAVLEIAEGFYQHNRGNKFKIDCRRTDKHFELDSYQLSCRAGALVLSRYGNFSVNLNHPDWAISIEIREKAYVYGETIRGAGGLPAGCAGRGLLLLSGGIDSPVAGYLMGKRGLNLDVIYFHTYPYTSAQTLDKVKHLAELLSPSFYSLKLYVVSFTEIQQTINEQAQKNEVTLHSRACMMHIADSLAKKDGHNCLITGESLSQVASQTPESIRYTGSFADLPVFRPLIGMDKEEIITIAKRINTYETSILPYPDCCTLFAPDHPLIKPDYERMQRAFLELNLTALLEQTALGAELVSFK